MQDIFSQLVGYIWGIWRFRWSALLCAWIVAVGGWIWVNQLPNQYEATARIQVDSNSILRPLLKGLAIQPDINQRINLMSKTLLSRPNLEKLMRMTDLDLSVKTDSEKDALIETLREKILLSGDRANPSLYSISFIDNDKKVAKQVVQSLINVFIESTLGDKRDDSADAQTFLDQQIADYENRLKEAEARLAAFKQKNVEFLPGENGDYYSNLTRLKQELNAVQLELQEAENRRDTLKRQIEGEEPVMLSVGASDSPAVSKFDSRIQALNAELDRLLIQYTEKHPKVIQIKSQISELEKEKRNEIKETVNWGSQENSNLDSNPVYQQMRAMLTEAEVRVAELEVRTNEYNKRIQALEGKINQIPEIEAQLKQLNRDYGVVQNQYTQLLARRESARISEDVEQDSGDVTFRVIDPPFVPLEPNAPNKLLLNSGVMIFALASGLGLALILSLFHQVVIDKRALAYVTGLPVLGSVTLVISPEDRHQMKINQLQFVSLFLGLVVVFIGFSLGPKWI